MNNLLLAENTTTSIVWLVVLLGLIVVMLVLPSISQKKRVKAYQDMQTALKVGDKVQTIGGIVGRIMKISEKDGIKTMLLETGDKNNKMVIEFNLDAIAGVVTSPNAPKETVANETAEPEEEPKDIEIKEIDIDAQIEEKKETAEKPKNNKKKK